MFDFTELKTDPELLKRIAIVLPQKMSSEDLRRQKISFIFGQTGGRIPREQIGKILDQQEGKVCHE